MKTKEKFVDEISGEEFDTKEAAVYSEKRSRDIEKTFAFYDDPKEKGNCDFANGEYCKQRTKAFYDKFAASLFQMIKKYEKWILRHYKKDNLVFQKKHLHSYFVGRCLCDNNSPLYGWSMVFRNICTSCYREHGQGYYQVNCRHNMKEKVK